MTGSAGYNERGWKSPPSCRSIAMRWKSLLAVSVLSLLGELAAVLLAQPPVWTDAPEPPKIEVTTDSLRLEALNEPVLTPGATGKLMVLVERKGCQGIVDIEGKGDKVTL